MKLLSWLNDPDSPEFIDPVQKATLTPALEDRLKELSHIPVAKVMVPRPLIKALDAEVQLKRVKRLKSSKVRYFPVYKGDLDHILGWIEKTKIVEILNEGRDDLTIEHHLNPIAKILDTASVTDLADIFLQAKSPLVIVVNSQNQCAGLVTLKDFVEILFGFDVESPAQNSLGDSPSGTTKSYEL